MNAPTTPPLQPIAWLGMHFFVPNAWEILRHSARWERGQITFADERRGRLHLAWAHAAKPPDVQRLLCDYRAEHLRQDAASHFEDLASAGPFVGYRWRSRHHWITRAGCYDRLHQRWIEVTLPWPSRLDAGLERAILESFRIVDERHSPARCCAFGLDVRSPAGWRLREARVQPGALTLRLTADDAELTVRRYRAADCWYGGDPESLVKKSLFGRRCRFETASYRGRDACLGRSSEPAPGWRRLFGASRRRTDLVWENPQARSLYHLTVVAPPSQPLDPFSFVVQDNPQEVRS